VAQTDVNQWCGQLTGALPSGTGTVAFAGNKAIVTVQWDDSRAAGGAQNQQFVVETRL
jgi:hypothetical protein